MLRLSVVALALVASAAFAVRFNADAAVRVETYRDVARGVTTAQQSRAANSGGLCDPNVTQAYGYVNFDSGNKHMFYWFFESRRSPSTDPLVVWLTGGPGCSSVLALLSENGPCKVDADARNTHNNPYSWTERANVIWVDSPVGSGYSYADTPYDTTEKGVSDDLYAFLQGFLHTTTGARFAKHALYISAESYGGHYAPALVGRIMAGNAALGAGDVAINLRGTSIGNGLVDPELQYPEYVVYVSAAGNPLKKRLVSELSYAEMYATTGLCVDGIRLCNTAGLGCGVAQATCNAALLAPYQATGLNPYDCRKQCTGGPLCYDFSFIGTWLNNATVKAYLGIPSSIYWQPCNFGANAALSHDWMKDYQTLLPPFLAQGGRVLVYSGDDDFIVNYQGGKAWSLGMSWPGRQAFNAAPDRVWGAQAALVRSYNNFTFMQVHNAGHMVPHDQPAVALNIIDQLVSSGFPNTH